MSVNRWWMEKLVLMALRPMKGFSCSLIRGIQNKPVMVIPIY